MKRFWDLRILLILMILGSLLLQNQLQTSMPTLEQHWNRTKISKADVQSLLTEEECHANARSEMACWMVVGKLVSAMPVLLEKFQAEPWSKSSLQKLKDPQSFLGTEKQIFESIYQLSLNLKDVNFDRIRALIPWNQLQEMKFGKAFLAQVMNLFYSITIDPHTSVIPISYFSEVMNQPEVQQIGLGFNYVFNDGKLLITQVRFPIENKGQTLRRGDQITHINGQQMDSFSILELQDILKTQAHLTLRARGIDFSVDRVAYTSKNISASWLSEKSKVAVIRIHKFTQGICEKVSDSILQYQKRGMRGLILDMRDNPGGPLDQAVCVTGLFVAKGTHVLSTVDLQSGDETVLKTENASIYGGPLAVVMNSQSASSAEIVAGALQDLGRAKVVGENSFGKGTFQEGIALDRAGNVALFKTKGFYVFPSGYSPQLTGIIPDRPIANLVNLPREKDLYLFPLMLPEGRRKIQSMKVLARSQQGYKDLSVCPDIDVDFSLDQVSQEALHVLSCQPLAQVGL